MDQKTRALESASKSPQAKLSWTTTTISTKMRYVIFCWVTLLSGSEKYPFDISTKKPSQVCCRCQDSRALCNNDLAKPVDVVDLRENEEASSSDRPRNEILYNIHCFNANS